MLAAGAVGVNIEDARHEAGVPLFVSARIDTFLRGVGGVDTTLERAAAFRAAGADGSSSPGPSTRGR
ncbi:isocitrate lyase/phosphoenolpyruvate mutase family protein [Streptomyces sp. NPDC054783]